MKLVVDASVLFSVIISKGKDLRGKILDVFFHEKVCAVWSDDPHFSRQSAVETFTTRELSKRFFS